MKNTDLSQSFNDSSAAHHIGASLMHYLDHGHYRLLTVWHLRGSLQPVFDSLFDSLRWPDWWPGAESVEEIRAGAPDGIGGIRHYQWKSLLPYRLSFDALAERIEAPCLLEGRVDGELRGTAKCLLAHDDGITTVRFEWHVHTTRTWMNMLAPVAHAVFAYNHRLLMERGARGLAEKLDMTLVAVEHERSTRRRNT